MRRNENEDDPPIWHTSRKTMPVTTMTAQCPCDQNKERSGRDRNGRRRPSGPRDRLLDDMDKGNRPRTTERRKRPKGENPKKSNCLGAPNVYRCATVQMAFDVEHITCGTFSPGVGLPTSACVDCGVHASCDAGHSTSCHPSASTGGVVQLCRLQRNSLQVVREDKHPVGSRLFRHQ